MGFAVSSSPEHAAFATLQGRDSLDVGSIFCGCWDMSPQAGTRCPTSCWQLGGQPSPPLPVSRSGPHPWLLAPWSSGPPSHKAPGDGVGQSRATSRLSALLRLVLHPTGSGLGCGHLGGGLLMRAGSEPAGRHSCGTRRCSNQREGDTQTPQSILCCFCTGGFIAANLDDNAARRPGRGPHLCPPSPAGSRGHPSSTRLLGEKRRVSSEQHCAVLERTSPVRARNRSHTTPGCM